MLVEINENLWIDINKIVLINKTIEKDKIAWNIYLLDMMSHIVLEDEAMDKLRKVILKHKSAVFPFGPSNCL